MIEFNDLSESHRGIYKLDKYAKEIWRKDWNLMASKRCLLYQRETKLEEEKVMVNASLPKLAPERIAKI